MGNGRRSYLHCRIWPEALTKGCVFVQNILAAPSAPFINCNCIVKDALLDPMSDTDHTLLPFTLLIILVL